MIFYTWPADTWSLAMAAAKFHESSWQGQDRKARRALALLQVRATRGTLRFRETTTSASLMSLPLELRLFILDVLKADLKADGGLDEDKQDSFDSADEENDDGWTWEKPSFDWVEQYELHSSLFHSVFPSLLCDLYDREFVGADPDCPCLFPTYQRRDTLASDVCWTPVSAKACSCCDPRRVCIGVKRWFRYSSQPCEASLRLMAVLL
jgi:hypothetical protein